MALAGAYFFTKIWLVKSPNHVLRGIISPAGARSRMLYGLESWYRPASRRVVSIQVGHRRAFTMSCCRGTRVLATSSKSSHHTQILFDPPFPLGFVPLHVSYLVSSYSHLLILLWMASKPPPPTTLLSSLSTLSSRSFNRLFHAFCVSICGTEQAPQT